MAVHKVGVFIVTNYFLGIYASYHWKVTENGKISSKVENSGFPLIKQDDLLALLEQERRLKTVSKLYQKLSFLKRSIDRQWAKVEKEGDLEKRLYSSDIDCLLGEVPLSEHNLYTEFLDYGYGSRPKMKSSDRAVGPDCTFYCELDFSMRTFPHLETLNRKSDFNLSMNPLLSKTVFNFNVDAMLKVNSSDWTAYNIASLYWRTLGNGTNALECAKRALYFSPRNQRYVVLLNLGTLLQELRSLGEAAIVLHGAVDHDPGQEISHLALGNVYAVLGDYKRSLACYDNVLSLNSGNVRAFQLKHALLCHQKLESALLETHSSLQRILSDLQKHNALHEQWLHLQSRINWEKNSKVKELFSLSQPVYLNLQMLLQNVEQKAKTLSVEVNNNVPKEPYKTAKGENLRAKKESGLECREEKISGSLMEDSSKENPECKRSVDIIEDEQSNFKSFVSSEYLLANKMNSLVTFIKSNYEGRT